MSKEVLSPDSLVVGVLAGGRGERLQKITGGDTPKVLVEVKKGRTILDVVYEGLYDQGFRKFVFLLNAGDLISVIGESRPTLILTADMILD